MHQPIPLADLQQRSRCNTQLQNHGFCTVDDGESDHEHAVQDVFDARTKPFRLENRSSSSQGSYGRGSQSSPSNEDVSTEYSRGSTDRDDMGALATRGVSPHRSTAEECPPRRSASEVPERALMDLLQRVLRKWRQINSFANLRVPYTCTTLALRAWRTFTRRHNILVSFSPTQFLQ